MRWEGWIGEQGGRGGQGESKRERERESGKGGTGESKRERVFLSPIKLIPLIDRGFNTPGPSNQTSVWFLGGKTWHVMLLGLDIWVKKLKSSMGLGFGNLGFNFFFMFNLMVSSTLCNLPQTLNPRYVNLIEAAF